MKNLMIFRLLALAVTFDVARCIAVTLPLDYFEPTSTLDGQDVADATDITEGFEIYNLNYPAISFKEPGSLLSIPPSTFSSISRVGSLSFNIYIESAAQETIISMSNSLEIRLDGTDICYVDNCVPLVVGEWNVVTVQTFIFGTFGYGIVNNGQRVTANIPVSEITPQELTVSSFDGSLACLSISDDNGVTYENVESTLCAAKGAAEPPEEQNPEPIANPEEHVCCENDTTTCTNLNITGHDFVETDNYTCKLQFYEFDGQGQPVISSNNKSVGATFVSSTEINCILPNGFKGTVTVESEIHGTLLNSDMQNATADVTILPAQCFDCNGNTYNANGNGCYIGNVCLSPYTIVDGNTSQICLPDRNAFGPSLNPCDVVEVHVNSCWGSPSLNLTTNGNNFESDELALAAASEIIKMNFAFRLNCTAQDSLIAQFPPGIKIYQNGGMVTIELNYLNPATGLMSIETIDIEVQNETWKKNRKRRRRYRYRHMDSSVEDYYNKCGKGDCQSRTGECLVNVVFRHSFANGTFLFVRGDERLNIKNTKYLQLLTTGAVKINKDIISCFNINNSKAPGYNVRRLCHGFVCRRRDCRQGGRWHQKQPNSHRKSSKKPGKATKKKKTQPKSVWKTAKRNQKRSG